jgi:hypothetical protein
MNSSILCKQGIEAASDEVSVVGRFFLAFH